MSKASPPEAVSVTILGVRIVNCEFHDALHKLDTLLQSPCVRVVFFVNAHTLNLAARNAAYLEALNSADVVFGDGTGVRWAARHRGLHLKANLNGTDLIPKYLEQSKGLRCYLLGQNEMNIEKTANKFQQTFPNCELVGFHHGYLDEAMNNAIVSDINAMRPDLILVGMGNPLQELWITRNRNRLNAGLYIGVGGLFSYWAGELDRAPIWMRNAGIEWLHIMRRQPRKTLRYLIGNPLFVGRTLLNHWVARWSRRHHG